VLPDTLIVIPGRKKKEVEVAEYAQSAPYVTNAATRKGLTKSCAPPPED
jgi:hypothetical protein